MQRYNIDMLLVISYLFVGGSIKHNGLQNNILSTHKTGMLYLKGNSRRSKIYCHYAISNFREKTKNAQVRKYTLDLILKELLKAKDVHMEG